MYLSLHQVKYNADLSLSALVLTLPFTVADCGILDILRENKLDVVVNAFKSSPREAEAGGSL